MRPTKATNDISTRRRRIGRKALQADRLSRALHADKREGTKHAAWRLPSMRPKTVALICLVAVVVGTLGIGGTQFYLAQVAATQKAAAAKQQAEQKAKSIAADACRRKKAEQKADQIGKVTYDELYDHGECDR